MSGHHQIYNENRHSAENSRKGLVTSGQLKEQGPKENAYRPVQENYDLPHQLRPKDHYGHKAPENLTPLQNYCKNLKTSLNNGELIYFKIVREKVKELKQIVPQDEKERKLKEELER